MDLRSSSVLRPKVLPWTQPNQDLTLPYKLLIKWIFMTFPERRIHLQTFDSTQYQTLWSKVADQINDFMQPEYTAWLIQPEPIVDDVDPLRQQLKTTQAFKLVAEFDESFSHVTLRPYAAESFGFKSVLLQRTEDGQLVFKYFYLREDRKTHMDEIYQVLSLLPSLRKELETKCNIKFDVYRALRSVEEISKNQSHSSLTSIVALPISLCDYEARVVE